MSSDSPFKRARRKFRADKACDFCRHRKLGCNNAKPKCGSCAQHRRDCTFTVRQPRQRPSNYRIQQLEEENAQLRNELEAFQKNGDTEENLPEPPSPDSSQPTPNTVHSFPPQEETIPDAVDTNFHGPTSALFDYKSVTDRHGVRLQAPVDVSDSARFLGETAKQRQMEYVHQRQELLDFHGIEPKLAMGLLSIFWSRQHATGSIVYRTSFMRDMACKGPYFSRLLLNAIYFVTSENAPNTPGLEAIEDCSQAGLFFRRRAEALLYDSEAKVLSTSSITTIQALLLLSDGLFSWCDERSLSWHYLGIATNMIIDLGLHSENSSNALSRNLGPEELEIRRRLFWAAFVMDKVHSIYQGRPARLRDTDCNVPLVFMDNFEELEPFNPLSHLVDMQLPQNLFGLPTHGVSTFQYMCKLSIIIDRILCSLYAEKSMAIYHESLYSMAETLFADLDQWKDSLPPHLQMDMSAPEQCSTDCVALPHTLSLILMYHSVVILLHRPFVCEGHLGSGTRADSVRAFSICEAAALEIDAILRFYKQRWCIKSPPYFVSYATYVSATIHVRLASLGLEGSQSHVCLQTCLEILGGHQVVARAPMQYIRILHDLARRLNVDVVTTDAAVSVSCSQNSRRTQETSMPSVEAVEPPLMTMSDTVSSTADTAVADGPNLDLFSLSDDLPFDINFDFDPLFGFDTY